MGERRTTSNFRFPIFRLVTKSSSGGLSLYIYIIIYLYLYLYMHVYNIYIYIYIIIRTVWCCHKSRTCVATQSWLMSQQGNGAVWPNGEGTDSELRGCWSQTSFRHHRSPWGERCKKRLLWTVYLGRTRQDQCKSDLFQIQHWEHFCRALKYHLELRWTELKYKTIENRDVDC